MVERDHLEIQANSSVRKRIDEAIAHHPKDWPDFLPPEIQIISTTNSGAFLVDCEFFALKTIGIMKRLQSIFPNSIVQSPQTGDIIVYFKKDQPEATHVGRYQEDGKIISKWGLGPVVKHEIDHVPSMYGNTVLFFKISDEELQHSERDLNLKRS